MPKCSTSHPSWRRAIAVTLILALQASGAVQAADLSQQMASMFGSGTLSNVSGPGAYRSQTQNVYVGGELQLRFPSRNYQLYSFTLPHISAGCGGIDAYLGSFSHISGEQFKEMLQAVARSYSGLLFKAALKSINPLIESVIGDQQKTLEALMNKNASTCDMARALMDGTSSVTGMTSESTCVTTAMRVWSEDLPAAQKRCKVSQTATNDAAKSSSDPAIKQLADRDLNLVWAALQASSLSTEEKTVFLNIAGTIVVFKPSNHGDQPVTPVEYPPAVDSLSALLDGHAAGNTADQVRINDWVTCTDTEECLTLTRSTVSITPFTTKVRQMLEGIRDAVMSRSVLQPEQVRFINMTRVPVYRMFSAGYTRDSSTQSAELIDLLINRYSKVIAYDYAYGFMRQALKNMKMYLGMARLRNAVEEAQAKRLITNVQNLMEEVEREHAKALGQIRDANAIVEDLQRVEREMQTALPGVIRGMLDMQNLMRGSGPGG
jgi:conjugative transfer pilus assembly protein TraH